ncbi:hypothetical protein HZP59_08805 [Elizabethkingia anophelis]|nr:hypothetical protein [Elizabethkingia anophelis]
MKTTIDNKQRIFQIIVAGGDQFFCNFEDIPNIIHSNNLIKGGYYINEFWNNNPRKADYKMLNEWFVKAKINFQF